MSRGNKSRINVGNRRSEGMKERPAYFEDYAKPVLVNWPFMLVAATALFIVGHLASRRKGRRSGKDNKSSSSEGSTSSGLNKSGQPMNLAELRAHRVAAAEARLRRGVSASGPGAAKPTPLGNILLLAREVDTLENETSTFLSHFEGQDPTTEKEVSRLLELLTQVQLRIDSIELDESVRPHRKTQTQRVQGLIQALEAIDQKA